jgi:hypothetical protein
MDPLFPKYLNPRPDYGYLTQKPRFLFAIHRRLTKVLDLWFGGVLYIFIMIFDNFESV